MQQRANDRIIKECRMAKLADGSREWFRVRQRQVADYVRALDALEIAVASTTRMIGQWEVLDDELKSALFHSALIHYARPFTDRREYGGKELRRQAGFDEELHGHLIDLRHWLVAHHDNDVLRALVGDQNVDLTHDGARFYRQ